ncbi:hypothetical protein NIES4075_51770 [Tolypothrix sp. NIES-4075]|uniref:ARPP-2 domain-containing protein n=1 Tax=Tolypothrix sp. NIES-4075 TaxID=2005459 RepID=UPI000B5CB60B|nr:hypothetical protein [Tolypothrix sp. NIES-4075]GAX44160.1 hypothetical protein NIES4075_51770 [Tolypothrix sp. NIES-4075]
MTLNALSHGLGCRFESSFSGHYIPGLEDALRVFEIHETQVGVLVFIAEAFTSAFIVSTPQHYRVLHTSLLEDFYGLLYDTTFMVDLSVDESKINSLADLRSERSANAIRLGIVSGFHGIWVGGKLTALSDSLHF